MRNSAAQNLAPNWALFLSGRGSTARAVLDCLSHVSVGLVVSSRATALGLRRAQWAGVPTLVFERSGDWQQLHQALLARRINRIFLLGFMRILSADFVQHWEGRIFNVHPSLLPQFPGAHAIQESYRSGAQMGVTIHRVTAEMDAGPRLLQKVLPVGGKRGSVPVSERDASEVPLDVSLQIAQLEQRLIRHLVERSVVR